MIDEQIASEPRCRDEFVMMRRYELELLDGYLSAQPQTDQRDGLQRRVRLSLIHGGIDHILASRPKIFDERTNQITYI